MTTKSKPAVRNKGLIDRYRDRLPIAAEVQAVSLGEGSTPLIRLANIPGLLSTDAEIYVKYEGANPTGSFKDRGMTVAVTKAVEEGSRAVMCASTGNTSAAAAAYAARAGLTAFVLIPEGNIALGKLAQAMIHGAKVIQIKGNFDHAMELVKTLAEEAPVTLVNSVNQYRIQGQKTIAFEIVEELGRAPDYHCLPVGNAGNITAHWIGYTEYATDAGDNTTTACGFCNGHCNLTQKKMIDKKPVLLGYQASGAAPFLHNQFVQNPDTVATAIRIGRPQSWDYAWTASRESGGWFSKVTDEQILEAQKFLAEKEGVFCEPASAASIAGLMVDLAKGRIKDGSTIVCTLTGHGLKDPDTAIRLSSTPITVPAEKNAVRKIILDSLR
jgi:threonine synthase